MKHHRKFHKNQRAVKYSKLEEKNCEMSYIRCAMSEGERTRARVNIADFKIQ